MKQHSITLPFSDEDLQMIQSGDQLLLTGVIFAARDEAHKRLIDLKNAGKPLPVDFTDALIYYVGPAPAKPGQVINSAGPTTSKRMDAYTADMLELGVKGMIGKGPRGEATKKLLKGQGIYMAVLGGVAAKQAKTIKKQEILAFEDAGMEALRKFEVEDFPVIVINDLEGNDAYQR
ncbi:MAG: FumA C-terminus/TtdB family hydratase beta subunit [Candidatus Gracilibacteria bacterium]|nr:FumA C-terminus/TtdB family hydratase beta subunit [Candidatus Gracilibacteria bacterium]